MGFVHVIQEKSAEKFSSSFHDGYDKVRAISAFTPKVEYHFKDGNFLAFITYTTVDNVQYDLSLSLETLQYARKKNDHRLTQEKRVIAPTSSSLIGRRKPTGRGMRTWRYAMTWMFGAQGRTDAITE